MEQKIYNGILPVFKEKGYTSNDVVALLRKFLKMKKIGHTGTLDPDATGLLPVCLGRGTKLVNLLTDMDKEYECVMRLGVTTDTEDMTGKVLSEVSAEDIEETDVKDTLNSFLGVYDQIPPMYSAKKINGRKLYEYAREGSEIERKPSKVEIKAIEITSIKLPLVSFKVSCSKGTYIRSLCRDAGERLGCGAAMEELKRVRVGSFELKDAHTLGQIKDFAENGTVGQYIISVESFFAGCGRFFSDGEATDRAIRNGNVLRIKNRPDGRYRVYLSDNTFAAIYDIKDGEARLCGYFLT